jgi:hypothetical protein
MTDESPTIRDRPCGISDEQLLAFADGVISDIEDHVFTCEHCQADLALMWEDALDINVAGPVVQAVRLDWLIGGILSTGMGVASRIAQGFAHYLTGRTET